MTDTTITLEPEPIILRIDGIRRSGLKIGQDLFILPYPYGHLEKRKIYKLHDKQPLGNAVLEHDDAIRLAQIYTKTYLNYLILWKDYPDMILHEVCKWTIPHGIEICEYFEAKLND